MATSTSIIFIFLTGIFLGWIYRSGRALSELKKAPTLTLGGTASRKGRVSILIPAKNEAKNIAECVRPFLPQLRDGDEILVINNGSTDGTETILKELGATEILKGIASAGPSLKFRYLNTPPTPEGWTGKNYALHLGIEYATGDWILFTDADTRHEPGSLDAALSFAESNQLDLLTLLPRCITGSFWEELIQPCAMAYMGLWFPIRKTNDPRSKVHFANGQYLLLRREHHQAIGGHNGVKEAFLEDFALMKKTKEAGGHGMCAFGMEIYGTRMYDSFDTLWRGWRRIFLHAFEQKPWALVRCVFSVFCFSILPFIILPNAAGHSVVAGLIGIVTLGIIFATAFKAYAIVKARKRFALLHPLAAIVFTAILIDALQMALFKRQTLWR